MSDIEHLCSLDFLLSFEKNGSLPNVSDKLQIVDDKKCISIKHRYIVLEYLLTVKKGFKLLWETWFHTVTLLDRCTEVMNFTKDKIQLYGLICMWISAKKYEIYPPELSDFIYICDGTFGREDYIAAEKEVFRILNFNADLPNLMEYIRYISSFSQICYDVHNITRFICVYYVVFGIKVLPTVLITAAHNIACRIVSNCDNKLDGSNPFLINKNICNTVCLQIQKRLIKHKNKSITTNVSELFRKTINNYDWDKLIDIVSSLTFVPKDPIPKECTPKHYVNQRKCIKTIKKQDVKQLEYLGEGSFGNVYKVMIDNDIYSNKKTSNCDNEGIRCNFIREISILQTLTHKNIISLHYIVENKENIILDIMDCDMRKYIDNNVPLRTNLQFQNMCTSELLTGMEYMHSCGVIHRDIKPQNMLVKGVWPNIVIKYCDFGGARGSGIVVMDGIYTHEVCTLNYRAPEILLGCKMYGPCTDVWSLMCTLSEIATGKILFCGSSELDQLHKIFQVMGTPIDSTWPNVSSLYNYKETFPMWKNNKDSFITKNSATSHIIYDGLILDPIKRPSAKNLLELFYTLTVINV